MKTTTIICPHCGQPISVKIDTNESFSTSESEKENKEKMEKIKITVVERDYGFHSSVSETESDRLSKALGWGVSRGTSTKY